MPESCFPERGAGNPVSNEKGGITRILLLLLLLLIGVAGYLYYFTDLIRPAKKTAQAPPAQTVQVKQPIPPRPDQPAGVGAAPGQPPAVTPPQAATPPAAAPVPAAQPGAAAPPAAVPAPVKPVAGQKPVQGKPAQAKPEPATAVQAVAPTKSAPPAAAAPGKTPPKAVKAAVAPAAPAKTAPGTKQAAKKAKPIVKSKGGPYSLLVGDFVPDKTLADLLSKMNKSGIVPVKKSSISAAEQMSRLFVAEFRDQDAAEAELQKLKKLTADSFLIADNGSYSLYAGSYLSESRIRSELQRLEAKGIKPEVRKATVTVKVTRVTAGSYENAEAARKDVQRLKKLGIPAKVVKTGN